MKISVRVNDEERLLDAGAGDSLAEVLRNQLDLTGVKRGCDSGGCGMCTIMLEGKCVYSCMTPFWKAEGKSVMTVEGLQKQGKYNELQESFLRNSAPQCGYCTPAMLLASKALIENSSDSSPTEEEIRDGLCGVLCRCTGYIPYLDAIREVIYRTNKKR